MRTIFNSKKFTKLIKVPISLLRELCIRIIIYLDGLLLMTASLEELLIAGGMLIFPRENLRFFNQC